MSKASLFTFETFARKAEWFDYWNSILDEQKPWGGALFIDRSPCSDPFFDPSHVGQASHRPTIGNLCRPGLRLDLGNVRLYGARIDEKIDRKKLEPFVSGWPSSEGNGLYAIVALLEVVRSYPNHQEAARIAFAKDNEWIPGAGSSPWPPNLLPESDRSVDQYRNLVPRSWSISYGGKAPSLPNQPNNAEIYRQNVRQYIQRAQQEPYAVCQAHFLNVSRPPVFSGAEILDLMPTAIGGKRPFPFGNANGRSVPLTSVFGFMEKVRERSGEV